VLVRWLFLRTLALIYLIAFVSLWVQIVSLIRNEGILPAKATMETARSEVAAARLGWDPLPFGAHAVLVQCQRQISGGPVCRRRCTRVLLLVGIALPHAVPVMVDLSFVSTVGREFLSFQWDILLLETGFLAIFFAPLQLLPRFSRACRSWRTESRPNAPSRVVLWLLRWLLFRLMFESCCVKWFSGDPTWRNLTALTFHYETQPLPTWIGWYAHQLPVLVQSFPPG